jgi:hypothetical protein
MFFPIFIGPAPTGKLGLIYVGTLLAFVIGVYLAWVKPLLDYEIATNPRMQPALLQIDQEAMAWIPLFNYVGIAFCVALIGVTGYFIYVYLTMEENECPPN